METIDIVKEKITEYLFCDLEDLEDDTHLVDDLGAEPLDIVEIIMALEDEFTIEINDENLHTINDLVKYINNNKVV